MNQRQEAKQAATSFCETKHQSRKNNGVVLNIAHITKHVMTSATEAELVALYIMAREAVYIGIILEKMVTNNYPHRSKQTIQWQIHCPTAKYKPEGQ